MNTKVYFNLNCILFTDLHSQKTLDQSIRKIEDFHPDKIDQLVSALLQDPEDGKLCYYYADSQLLAKFISHFQQNLYFIEAAGGLIKKGDKYLFIYRLGKWDLPKGKLDKGEGIREAAIRECEEECGIDELKIEHALSPTFHVYKYKSKLALKRTHWFFMSSTSTKVLKPQLEENIEEVKWFGMDEINSIVKKNSYYTILDVIEEGLS